MKVRVHSPEEIEIRISAYDYDKDVPLRVEDLEKLKGKVALNEHLITAAKWVNESLTEFRFYPGPGELFDGRWRRHADRIIVDEWLTSISANDDSIVIYFVCSHVIGQWLEVPARTLTMHQQVYSEIEKTAEKLAFLLHATQEPYFPGGGHGLRGAAVWDLFTAKEKKEICAPVDASNAEHPSDFETDSNPKNKPASPHIRTLEEMLWNPEHSSDVEEESCPKHERPSPRFPTLEELLWRISSDARRLCSTGPLHSQPTKDGAVNVHFIRTMDGLLVSTSTCSSDYSR